MTIAEAVFEKDEVIFSEGELGADCFRIIEGAVEIRLRSPGFMKADRSNVVATLGAGEVFGEMSVIDHGPRSATAVAIERTRCVRYPAEHVVDLIRTHPEEAFEIIKSLVTRLRSANRKLSRTG
ncbi:MAG: cyclic nucleotide-binding domain-containing protein [Pseudomonadota bacterium]